MSVHQETVDSYLEDVIVSAVDTTSGILARGQVREYATRLNTVIDELDTKECVTKSRSSSKTFAKLSCLPRDHESLELMVSDMVFSFLVPEVEREAAIQQGKAFLDASFNLR